MILESPDAISRWRNLIGPTDARKAKTSHPDRLRTTAFLFLVENIKGAENPVADNLSRLENVLDDPLPIDDSFLDEQLNVISTSR